jgi:hypothetical protein
LNRVLWAAAFSTSLACATAFASVLIGVRLGRDREEGARSIALHLLVLGARSSLSPSRSTNNPPRSRASCRGRARDGHRAASETSVVACKTRLLRAIMAGVVGASVVAAYVINVRVNGQRGLGNDPDSYVPLAHLPSRIIEIFDGLVGWIALQPLAAGRVAISLARSRATSSRRRRVVRGVRAWRVGIVARLGQ